MERPFQFMGQTRSCTKWLNFVRRGGHRPSATTDLKNFADTDGQWPPLLVFLVYPGCPVNSNGTTATVHGELMRHANIAVGQPPVGSS